MLRAVGAASATPTITSVSLPSTTTGYSASLPCSRNYPSNNNNHNNHKRGSMTRAASARLSSLGGTPIKSTSLSSTHQSSSFAAPLCPSLRLGGTMTLSREETDAMKHALLSDRSSSHSSSFWSSSSTTQSRRQGSELSLSSYTNESRRHLRGSSNATTGHTTTRHRHQHRPRSSRLARGFGSTSSLNDLEHSKRPSSISTASCRREYLSWVEDHSSELTTTTTVNNREEESKKRAKIAGLLDKCAGTRFPFRKKLSLANLGMTLHDIPLSALCGSPGSLNGDGDGKSRLGQSLHTLSLTGNTLGILPDLLVQSLPLLIRLNLSHCALHSLPTVWNLPQLKTLDLSHNMLSTFPGEVRTMIQNHTRELSCNIPYPNDSVACVLFVSRPC